MARQVGLDLGFQRMEGLAFSSGVIAGDYIFVSGQVPVAADGTYAGDDLGSQTRQVFENVGVILESGGASFNDVVRVTAHIVFDIHDRSLVEEYFNIRAEYLTHKNYAGSGVQVMALHDPRFLLEVDVVAMTR